MRSPSCLFAAFGLAALVTSFAGVAPAGEAPLPPGWVRGAGITGLPKGKELEWGSFQKNHESTFQVRRTMRGERHEVGALPVVEVEPAAPAGPPPAELPEGQEGDVSLARRGAAYRLSVHGFDLGFVQVRGSSPTGVGKRGEGGAVGTCGAGGGGVVPISYEGIRRVEGEGEGAIELVWARGFLDTGRCRAAVVERHAARARHLAGGAVYAFRTRCAACGDGARDVLHVLTPQTGGVFARWTPFEHHTLALGPGRAAAFEGVASFLSTSIALPDWDSVIDRGCHGDRRFCVQRLRVEVSQAASEPEPTLFVSGDVEP